MRERWKKEFEYMMTALSPSALACIGEQFSEYPEVPKEILSQHLKESFKSMVVHTAKAEL